MENETLAKDLLSMAAMSLDGCAIDADELERIALSVEKLEHECRQMRKELDAAIADIPKCCATCRHRTVQLYANPCHDCMKSAAVLYGMWEWRGVQE